VATCPRCNKPFEFDLYGPCGPCRMELRKMTRKEPTVPNKDDEEDE
jgi:hypothetical protein